ncbi:hypothetical protein IEQ34_006189 [Dendrobium chrysotoxum]|uniref:ATP synthase alpha subunit C-terminal domain-containing protein n=1 Tax=Dendrobium chrysotoxum TaxID=161865 RepID=A0AAV7HBV1_DENCH|nr:hypothetical protein IEQ34_006189 [Dendrobium chrysotoxum]
MRCTKYDSLPIVETQPRVLLSYININVISITDIEIFLSIDLFMARIRHAINVGIFVSRIIPQFAYDIDKDAQNLLARGQQLCQLFKQSHSDPLILEDKIATI